MGRGWLGLGYHLDLINSDFNSVHQLVKHLYFHILGDHKCLSCSIAHCVVFHDLPYHNQEIMCDIFSNLRGHDHETQSDALLNPLSLILKWFLISKNEGKKKSGEKKKRMKEREWMTNCLSYNDGTGEAKEEEGWLGGEEWEGIWRRIWWEPHPSVPSVCPNMEASAVAWGLFSRPTTDQGKNWRGAKGGG